jgi:putative adhesin
MHRAALATALIAAACTLTLSAQSRNRDRSPMGCDDRYNSDRPSYCEVREETIATGAVNPLDVDAGQNGGIRVRGWDRPEVHMRARISASGDSDAEARQRVAGIRIVTGGGSIHAEGPAASGDGGWSVSYELDVPRTAILTLHTHNGGISIGEFQGTANFRAVNGGVTLTNVGGDIRGETTNGGVTVDLSSDRWEGAGLDVETKNGGIKMSLPEHFSAALETATTNGRINIDFPVTVSGQINLRHLTTTLGAGGARIRAVTTNGAVRIERARF